jgi:chorismate synthase
VPPGIFETTSMCELRDLVTLEEYAAVVGLERQIWGFTTADDLIPIPLLAVGAIRGAILVGAFDDDRLVGFVYSFPAIRRGRLSHWSHMLGVLEPYRGTGLGFRLKLAQRERARAMGIDLVEWTFDPLLVVNARFNVTKLGAVVEEYRPDFYGPSTSPLHGNLPTDRFIAQWRIDSSHVERRVRVARSDPSLADRGAGAASVNQVVAEGAWLACPEPDLSRGADRLLVHIPPRFLEMLASAPDLAREWRLRTREIFTTYLDRGYRIVEFRFDRGTGGGSYLLSSEQE